MEGLDYVILYVALTPQQAEALLAGNMAMPQETSGRYGLRTTREEALVRSHYFMEWNRQHIDPDSPELGQKDFVLGTLKISAIGYLQKSLGGVLEKTKPTEFRWKGGIQYREVLSDNRILYEFINFEKVI